MTSDLLIKVTCQSDIDTISLPLADIVRFDPIDIVRFDPIDIVRFDPIRVVVSLIVGEESTLIRNVLFPSPTAIVCMYKIKPSRLWIYNFQPLSPFILALYERV